MRGLFERGATSGEYGPNWVAGWLLYSVFRSRDVRNNRNRRKGEVGVAGSESGMYYVFLFLMLPKFIGEGVVDIYGYR